jgi:hypothetical protein
MLCRANPASAGPFRLSKTSFEVVAVFTFKSRQARVEQFALGDDDDVKARRDLVTPEHFADEALRAVPLDRSSQPFRRGNTQSAYCQCIRQCEERRQATLHASPSLVHLLKLGAAPDAFGRSETRQASPYSLLTVNRLRPLARRRLSTSRPFFVLMRTRNPCVLLRCRLFG